MVSVDTKLFIVVAGENDSLTVGAAGVTVMTAGHAVALVPAEVGAVLAAVSAVSVTVSVSMFPAESVTAKVKVPVAGLTVTRALFAPLTMRLDGEAVHAYEAMLSGAGAVALPLQAATLPLASNSAPGATLFGITITPIGRCAALTALNAFTMPAPH
jgi:hypothetical protein